MAIYETVFMARADLSAKQVEDMTTKFCDLLKQNKGKILKTENWGIRKLAYQINGHRKGTYWIVYFRIDGNRIPEFERACRLNDNILRNLTLAVDPAATAAPGS